MAKEPDKSIRRNVVLTRSSEERIRKIRSSNDLTSDAEAIRKALQFYERMMNAQIGGCAVEILTPNGDRIRNERLYDPYAVTEAVDTDQLLSY
jgi:hypothetical protein